MWALVVFLPAPCQNRLEQEVWNLSWYHAMAKHFIYFYKQRHFWKLIERRGTCKKNALNVAIILWRLAKFVFESLSVFLVGNPLFVAPPIPRFWLKLKWISLQNITLAIQIGLKNLILDLAIGCLFIFVCGWTIVPQIWFFATWFFAIWFFV